MLFFSNAILLPGNIIRKPGTSRKPGPGSKSGTDDSRGGDAQRIKPGNIGMENCTGVTNRNTWGDFLKPPDTDDEQHLDKNKNEPRFPAGSASKTQNDFDF